MQITEAAGRKITSGQHSKHAVRTFTLNLQRKYIRTHPDCIALKNFHSGYKNWETTLI
jgi:hypothetical protein